MVIMSLKDSIVSRMGDKINLNNQGVSESQFVYICITGCMPGLITVLIIWKYNLFNLFNWNRAYLWYCCGCEIIQKSLCLIFVSSRTVFTFFRHSINITIIVIHTAFDERFIEMLNKRILSLEYCYWIWNGWWRIAII